jgi:hypothetical protein
VIKHKRQSVQLVGRSPLLRLLPVLIVTSSLLNTGLPQAAPLDPLMSSRHTTETWHGELEISIDSMSDAIDVLDIRGGHQDFAGTSVGDYSGGHLQGGIALTEQFWLEGSWWDRTLDYHIEAFNLQSWHLSTQYRLNDGLGVAIPDLALKATLWGNYAAQLTKSSSTSLFGRTVDKIDILKPKDNQWQMDVVATWDLSDATELTLFAGGGQIDTDFDKLLASGRVSGVVDVNDTGTIQTILDNREHPLVESTLDSLLASDPRFSAVTAEQPMTVTECLDGICGIAFTVIEGGDSATITVDVDMQPVVEGKTFTDLEIALSPQSNKISVAGIDVLDNIYGVGSGLGIQHDAKYYQLGGSLMWYNRNWRLRGGYKMLYVDRGEYEDLVQQFGRTAEIDKINNILVGDLTYRLTKKTALFLRGQVMSNQFLGEIPFSYTPYTAHRFDEKYGFISAGINYYF